MMKLHIDNIGIVKDSNIELNGITVITGYNNSGKTTVSKVLYSLISSVEDLGKCNLQDKNNAAQAFVENMSSEIWLRLSSDPIQVDYADRRKLLHDQNLMAVGDAEKYLESYMQAERYMLQSAAQRTSKSDAKAFYLDLLSSVEEKVKNFSKKLKYDYEPVNYVNQKLDGILNVEFNNQILHVNAGMDSGVIQLVEDGKTIFDVLIGKDGLKKSEKTFFMSLFDSKCIFVDDVYVLDDLIDKVENSEKEDSSVSFLLRRLIKNNTKIKLEKHKQKLINSLWNKDGISYDSTLDKEKVVKIYDKLEPVFDDRIVLKGGKLVRTIAVAVQSRKRWQRSI